MLRRWWDSLPTWMVLTTMGLAMVLGVACLALLDLR